MKGVIDSKSECRIQHRIRRNQEVIDLITLKLKSEIVKPASKQVSWFMGVVYKVAGVDHRYKH